MASFQSSNLLITNFEVVQSTILKFKEEVKKYYFSVLLTRYRCPRCNNRFKLVAPSRAECECGHCLDPTVEFQRCPDCGGKLSRKTFHYSCVKCGRVACSIFLFDEKIFDNQYFQERMRESRERKRETKAELRQMLMASRSTVLLLTDEINLNNIPGLQSDLDSLLGKVDYQEEYGIELEGPSLGDYQRHVMSLLDSEILFSAITPLCSDGKKDKIMRFISLIFMEQDQEVWLSQYGNDILVEKYEPH